MYAKLCGEVYGFQSSRVEASGDPESWTVDRALYISHISVTSSGGGGPLQKLGIDVQRFHEVSARMAWSSENHWLHISNLANARWTCIEAENGDLNLVSIESTTSSSFKN